ncbi:ferredoxin [Pacificoceanicola onchidii]|uniref:ferredoxin n=1 Tax=Pacificoceanicola onchidii TaxID=2562685 RepID=UPI001F0EEB72|nr:ferredoxin [Pacificoceanicola onchidii]
MTTLEQIENAAHAFGLCVRGLTAPKSGDSVPEGTETVVLLGPDEPAFWRRFATSAEYSDNAPDPLDRWSKRIITEFASEWGGVGLFPSDGPPYPPFFRWALDSGQAWSSPVQLLVQAEAGLFVSYRGAVALPFKLKPRTLSESPCTDCPAPCTTACPAGALGQDQDYDIPACKAHMRSAEGAGCVSGCLVRRACPVSRNFRRDPAQSAFHMAAFLEE